MTDILQSTKANTSPTDWWKIANDLLEDWHLDAMRYGPAYEYYEAGLTVKEAVEREHRHQTAKRL